MPESKNSPGDSIPGESSYLPHVAKGALINFSGIISRTVFLYVYTFILARMLSIGDLGTYFLIFTVINLFGLAANVGLDQGVVRYVSLFAGEKNYGQARKVVRTALQFGIPVGIAFTALLFLAAPLINQHFLDDNPASVTVLRVFALALPFMVAARLFNAVTQGMHVMKYQVYSRDLGEQFSKVVLSLTALALGAGLLGVVWANVAAVALATAMALFFALIVLPSGKGDEVTAGVINESAHQHGSPARVLLRYSYPLAFANVLVALWLQVDTLLLGLLGTTADVGLYGVAIKLSLFGAKILTAFSFVFAPVISDLWNREKVQELSELYITVSRWIFIISFPILLVIVLFSDSLMNIFGAEFITGNEALILLAVGQLVNAATGAAGLMMLMSGRSKVELFNVAVALVVDVVLCIVLIPGYGFVGAAIAHMASLVLVNLMRVVEVWLFMRMFAYNKSFMKPVVAGVASAIIVTIFGLVILKETGVVQLLVFASILIIFYVLTMAILGLDEQDKSMVKRIKAGVTR